VETKIIEFIKKDILEDSEINIEPGTKLISSGIIDSFSLVLLQAFLEKEFGKKIPAPSITAENFDTINQMIELINRF
jgi:acyl carrier protein